MESKILTTTSSFNYSNEVIPNPFKRKLTEQELIGLINEYQPEAIIAGVEPITAKVLQSAKNLKIVARVGVGMDNVDTESAEKMGIKVTNTPDAVTAPVAELTIGMILSLIRMIHLSDRKIREGTWERPTGSLLKGKTVGIIGLGRIGKYVAKLLTAFDTNIIAHDPFYKEDNYTILPVNELLQNADIVTMHLPLTTGTQNIIAEKEINLMKETAFIINASRGGIINEKALITALNNKKIAGAAFDCFDEEPYTGELKSFDNVLLTGHIGSYAKEARYDMEKQAYEAVINYLKA